jgi:hypothetical protein
MAPKARRDTVLSPSLTLVVLPSALCASFTPLSFVARRSSGGPLRHS